MENAPVVNNEIIKLIAAEAEEICSEMSYYIKLYNNLIDEEDKKLLSEVILTKKKHMNMLSDLYYRFKGERLGTEPVKETDTPTDNLPAEFRKAALSELDQSEISRGLGYDFLNQSVRDTLNEISSDEQNNSQRFAILLAKYS